MSTQVFQNMLGDFMSNQMTEFLKRVSDKYNIEFNDLADDWSSHSKTKTNKPPSENTIASLKAILKEKGLPISGNKSVLKQRLEEHEKGNLQPKNKEPTVKELKALLKEKGLPISGNKSVQKQRLDEHELNSAELGFDKLYNKYKNDTEFYNKYKNDMDEARGDEEELDYIEEATSDWLVDEIKDCEGDNLDFLVEELTIDFRDRYEKEMESD